MRILIVLITFLTSSLVSAGGLSLKYGFGAESGLEPQISQRMLNVGYQSKLWKQLVYNLNSGIYFDNHRQLSVFHAFAEIGPRIKPTRWLYIENLFGPGLISRTDDLLGTNFQFSLNFGIGLVQGSTSFGLTFKHFSNAGIREPNTGRNFWLFSVIIPI